MKKLSVLLMVFFATLGSLLAQRTITGKVTDVKGEGVIGANVVAKGTNTGAATDADGNYRLNVPNGTTMLVVTYVGFNTKQVALGASNIADVTLEENSNVFADVVVTGTGVGTDKRFLPIDVQSIGSKGLPPAPSASVDQALVGKVAGAQISSVNGTPGAKVSILLRGINTLNRGTAPMIMLDGVELGVTDLNTIDMNTVDRIEIVQGAASASLYGAQGANGVIQLFSKKGKSGKVNIDFSTSYSTNEYLNIGGLKKADMHGFKTDASGNVIGASGKPLMYDTANGSYSENVVYTPLDPTIKIDKPYGNNLPYVDHFAMFLQPAATKNNSLSISGGKDKFDFAISASNNHQESNFKNNGYYDRSNLTTNLGFELIKGFNIRSITNLAYTHNTINDNGVNSTIYSLFNSRPFLDYSRINDDGNYSSYQGDAGGVNGFNPFYVNKYSSRDKKKVDLAQSFNANYQPFKWLILDAKYGINYQTENNPRIIQNQSDNTNANDQQYWYTVYSSDANGEIINYESRSTFQNFLTSANFNFALGESFKSSTLVGYDYRNKNFSDYRSYGLGLPNYTPFNTTQATTQRVERDYKEPFVTYGFFASEHLDYKTIAGITVGIRSDYSSAFGGGSKPFTFPRADIYLRPSDLGFWKDGGLSKLIPEFKLRAATGSAGIQPKPFDRYVTLSTKTIGGTNAFYFGPNQSNPDLSVEVSKETEFGAEMTFALLKGDFLNSLTFSPTYWKRSTENAIFNVDFIPSTGIGTYKNNAISIGSSGIQFSLGAQIADKEDFNWRFTTNFGKQSSKITKLNGPEIVLLTAAGSTGYVLTEGQKIGQIYGYLGLHAVNELDSKGKPYISADAQKDYSVASNGWVVNNATKQPYFTLGQYAFGDPNPTFNASFINAITIKKFVTLNFQFDWIQGSHLYNQTKEWMYRDGIHSDYQQPITINGETGAWASFYRGVYAFRSRNGTKSYFYEDASFVRLRNVELSFDLSKIITIPGFRKTQLVLSGRNLWTKTKYTGMDPEVNSSNAEASGDGNSGLNSSWDRGTDHNTMPNLKSYQIGLNIGF